MAVLSSDRIEELRSSLPPRVFAELLEECLSDLDLRLPALRHALASGVPGAVTMHAHTMAGLAAGYGMEELEAQLRRVVGAARDNTLEQLGGSLILDIEAGFAEAKGLLREIAYRDFDPLPQAGG